ncbi:hypothetical protein ACFU1Q_11550 [Brachybacterium paraconglomeratum]
MAWFDEFNLPGATITGHFAFVREDGPDVDDAPDLQLASGKVRFEPTAKAVRANGAWVGISPVTAQIFEGEIIVAEEDPRPLRLLSTDADTGVEGWGWEATFDIEGASIKPIRFHAPATGVHLTGDDLIPITGNPVEVIAQGGLDRLAAVESTVTAHTAALDGKVDTADPRLTDDRPPTAHEHDMDDVNGLAAALSAKVGTTDPRLSDARPPTAHQHPVSDVTGLAARLAALEYSSGERDITSLLPAGTVVSGALHLLRTGTTCWLDFRDLTCADPTTSWHSWPGLLPNGFRPPRSFVYMPLPVQASVNTPGPVRLDVSGGIVVYGITGQKRMTGLVSWPTLQAPPTTPPGAVV